MHEELLANSTGPCVPRGSAPSTYNMCLLSLSSLVYCKSWERWAVLRLPSLGVSIVWESARVVEWTRECAVADLEVLPQDNAGSDKM